MKHQHNPRSYGRRRKNRGQPRITSGQLTVHPSPYPHDQYHYQSSDDDDYPYASSNHVKSEPGQVMLSNGQGASSYNGSYNDSYNGNYNGSNSNSSHYSNSNSNNNVNNSKNNVNNGNNNVNNGNPRTNAFEDDNSMDQATIVKAIRSRIAEIDKDFPRLARTKAKIHLELDRHDPRGAVHSRLLATHETSLQAFADLKERRDTLTEVLADLMLVQKYQQEQEYLLQGAVAPAAPAAVAASTGSTGRVLPERNERHMIVDRALVMKPNMPTFNFGYGGGRTTINEPEEFLHRFEQYMTSFLGHKRLLAEGYRYMVVLVEDMQLQTELYTAFESRNKATLTIQECAHIFRQLVRPVV